MGIELYCSYRLDIPEKLVLKVLMTFRNDVPKLIVMHCVNIYRICKSTLTFEFNYSPVA